MRSAKHATYLALLVPAMVLESAQAAAVRGSSQTVGAKRLALPTPLSTKAAASNRLFPKVNPSDFAIPIPVQNRIAVMASATGGVTTGFAATIAAIALLEAAQHTAARCCRAQVAKVHLAAGGAPPVNSVIITPTATSMLMPTSAHATCR